MADTVFARVTVKVTQGTRDPVELTRDLDLGELNLEQLVVVLRSALELPDRIRAILEEHTTS